MGNILGLSYAAAAKLAVTVTGALLLWTGAELYSSPAQGGVIEPQQAVATGDFLDTIGVVTSLPDRGQNLEKTIEMLRHGGFRWVRDGPEGMRPNGRTTIETYLTLHREAGVKFSWGLLSGGTDIENLLETGRVLADAGALIAFEGNNEPNNWGIRYQGERGGRGADTWLPVAKLQRDLYAAVKADPELAKYPVWTISEPGSQIDNTGLQFLTIPPGAETLMPAGTRYGDYANVHNYIYHPNVPFLADNKVWDAADPTRESRVNGLFHNFGRTWFKKFPGYSDEELAQLPRVTTETGMGIRGPVTEEIHGLHLLNVYLAQFKRGYAYTAVYILRDRTDEGGNQAYGFFKPNYKPRLAATYLHNLTTILADEGRIDAPAALAYAIPDMPDTVHDLLFQRSDGVFQLVVWGERLQGEDVVEVLLGDKPTSITLYDPVVGQEPVATMAGTTSFELTLSDHPIVVEIVP